MGHWVQNQASAMVIPVLWPGARFRKEIKWKLYVNPEMRETLGFPFQNGRFVKPGKTG